jgi:hypothetical protein
VDLDADGHIDILSGSYSRMDSDMAGLFQVLRGQAGRTYSAPEPLKGTDNKPLIIDSKAGDEGDVERICTRPCAVDIDGDGDLDIVSGNFTGTFALFTGEGKGRFNPKSTWLKAGGGPMNVDAHSDPFFVDWDRDGDLDLLSGSAEGGVFLFTNEGTAKKPRFGKRREIVPPAEHRTGEPRMGDGHLTGPQSSTRVWAEDVNGDGQRPLEGGTSSPDPAVPGPRLRAGALAAPAVRPPPRRVFGTGSTLIVRAEMLGSGPLLRHRLLQHLAWWRRTRNVLLASAAPRP